MPNRCSCHGFLTDVQAARELARKTKHNVPVCFARPSATAMDSANADVDDAVIQAKIARVRRRIATDDAAITKMFPALVAIAKDDAENEQASSDEDSPDNEVEGASYEATLKASVDYWNNVKRINSQRAYAKSSGAYAPVPTAVRNKAKAVDGKSIALNARRAKGYSLFNSGTRITKLSNQRASL